MNIDIIRIQKKGLVTLPKKMRDAVGLEENGYARITKEGKKIILEPVRIDYPVRSYTEKEVDDFITTDREETTQLA